MSTDSAKLVALAKQLGADVKALKAEIETIKQSISTTASSGQFNDLQAGYIAAGSVATVATATEGSGNSMAYFIPFNEAYDSKPQLIVTPSRADTTRNYWGVYTTTATEKEGFWIYSSYSIASVAISWIAYSSVNT